MGRENAPLRMHKRRWHQTVEKINAVIVFQCFLRASITPRLNMISLGHAKPYHGIFPDGILSLLSSPASHSSKRLTRPIARLSLGQAQTILQVVKRESVKMLLFLESNTDKYKSRAVFSQ